MGKTGNQSEPDMGEVEEADFQTFYLKFHFERQVQCVLGVVIGYNRLSSGKECVTFYIPNNNCLLV